MCPDVRQVPSDFGDRLRAARAYAEDVSRGEFAERLGLAGASASNLRVWESGRRAPSPLIAEALLPRIAEATGIEEAFLWGNASSSPVEDRLAAIEEELRLLRAETVARDAEVLKRIEEGLATNSRSQSGRPQ